MSQAPKQPGEVFADAGRMRLKNQLKNYRNARTFLLGVTGVSLSLAIINKYYYKSRSQEEVDYKKARLAQPVVDLTDSNGTTIPWSLKNRDEWLFRPVRITGRPLHNRAVLLPSRSMGLDGYEYVVPLCTKETAGGDPIEGVFINKGFVPHEFSHVASRFRIEDSFHQQEFTAYLSKLDNFTDKSPLQRGNTPTLARNHWNYADLKEMSNVSGFQNKAVVSAGVLESVNLDTPLDERHLHTVDVNADYREDYPYRKTLSGALKSNNMPWDYERRGDRYLNLGVASGILAVLLSF